MNTVEKVAWVIDPKAFCRTHFNKTSSVITQPGDFERTQESAREKARAAIAAVLDDMAEPSDVALHNSQIILTGNERFHKAVWEALLAAYRKEVLEND